MFELPTLTLLRALIKSGTPLHSHAVISLALQGSSEGLAMYDKMMKFYRPAKENHVKRIKFLAESFRLYFDIRSCPIEVDSNHVPIDGNHRFTYALISGAETVWCTLGEHISKHPKRGDTLMELFGFDDGEKSITLAQVERLKRMADETP